MPVVTTTGGFESLVRPLSSSRRADGLVKAMRVARRDVALANAGRARAAGFTWTRTVDLTVAAYRVMLSHSERPLA